MTRGAAVRVIVSLATIGLEFARGPHADGAGEDRGVLDFIPVTPTSGQTR